MTTRRLSAALVVAGFALVVAGVALVWLPAAIACAGAGLLAFGLDDRRATR